MHTQAKCEITGKSGLFFTPTSSLLVLKAIFIENVTNRRTEFERGACKDILQEFT